MNIETGVLKKISILSWLDIPENSKILLLGFDDKIVSVFKHIYKEIFLYTEKDIKDFSDNFFNYIFILDINKITFSIIELYRILDENGKCYLTMENSNAISCICTNKKVSNDLKKEDLRKTLNEKGFIVNNVYSVFPSTSCAKLIISEGYLINESLTLRYLPEYEENIIIKESEAKLLEEIKDKKEFHSYANDYLFELTKNNNDKDALLQVTLSPDRGKDCFCVTKLFSNKVEKYYPLSFGNNIIENNNYLLRHGVKTIKTEYIDNKYVMKYVKEENLVFYFRRLLKENTKLFLSELDRYYNVILKSSKIICFNELGPILERCYIDLVPLNAFYYRNDFLFFDQEFYIENYPANLIMWRTIYIIFEKRKYEINKEDLWERYNFSSYEKELCSMSDKFIKKLRNQKEGTY